MKPIAVIFFILLSFCSTAQYKLVTYPAPMQQFSGHSEKFLVKISQKNKTQDSYVYVSKSGNKGNELGDEREKTFNYTIFSFSGPITIEVTKLGSNASKAIIRPNRLNIGTLTTKAVNNGQKISFKLNHPGKISVEFDDDPTLKDALMIFADTIETAAIIPNPNATNVFLVKNDSDVFHISTDKDIVYFPAGLYQTGYWQIPSFIKQVYISGGCFLRGYLFAERTNASSLTMNGRGIISNDIYPFHYPSSDSQKNIANSHVQYIKINISGGKGHFIEGLTLVDASSFNLYLHSSSSLIKNVNIHGFKYTNDGITSSGNNDSIDNCFLHVNEDAIVLYGNSITIKNCIFWQPANGSTIQLGWWPHSIKGTNLIDNCDILHTEWKKGSQRDIGFISALNVTNPSDKLNNKQQEQISENFTLQNIYFDTEIIRFLDLRRERKVGTLFNQGQPWSYQNFIFKNIHLIQPPNISDTLVYLASYDKQHQITNFTFDSLYINGGKVEITSIPSTLFSKEALEIIKLK